MTSPDFVDAVIATGIRLSVAEKQMATYFSDIQSGPCDIFSEVDRKVAFLFTSRSGTTFFVDVLNRSGRFGEILEHMNPAHLRRGKRKWECRSNDEYLRECVRRFTSENGVFGFKSSAENLLPLVQANEIPANVHDWHWITIRRRDTIAQAVSLFRAKATDVWHDRGQLEREPDVPEYDEQAISRQLTLIQQRQGQIDRFITTYRIEPLRLVYEDYADDPIPALRSVFDHVGIPAPDDLPALVEASGFKVLRNRATEDLADRHRQLLNDRLGTR